MDSARDRVDFYTAMFRQGREADAFHGLIESDSDVVPELIALYDRVAGNDLRAFILGVVSEFHRPFDLSFLKQELLSTEPAILRRALDGLSNSETPESVQMMTEAVARIDDPTKRQWVMEAIRDTTIAIKKRAEHGEGGKASPATS